MHNYAKFWPKWTLCAYSHVIYHWKGILKLISVIGMFVDVVEAETCIIRIDLCIISVLSPPFYGIQKFGSVGPKFPDLSGRVGAPEGRHFSLFGAI